MNTEIDLDRAYMLAPYLGQDFLTWLWFHTETRQCLVQSSQGEEFVLCLEQRVSVLGGEGPAKDTAVCSGPASSLREARLGLRMGKKVDQAKLRITLQENDWELQLRADDFSLSGLKTPKVRSMDQEDPEGELLEKIYLMEKAWELLDDMYLQFLQLRLGEEWEQEAARLARWINDLELE
ncbi:MAG: hypothetical protein ACLFRL_08390 [Desulfohalobiaceae bacterium]